MFRQTYKATLKNLFRSEILWIIIFISVLLVAFSEHDWYQGYTHELYGFITDNDPRYVVSFNLLIEKIGNIVSADVMPFIMPLFSIISTVLVIIRSYGDNFYEVEKAFGVKPHTYLFARFSALITINFAVVSFLSFFAIHYYIGIRGGVNFIGLGYYITQTTVRILRLVIVEAVPCITMYITLTLMLGSLLQNGITPAIISSACVVSNFVYGNFFRFRFPEFIRESIAPIPTNVICYMLYYDTEGFEYFIAKNNYKFSDVIFYFLLYFGASLLFLLITYIRQYKRET